MGTQFSTADVIPSGLRSAWIRRERGSRLRRLAARTRMAKLAVPKWQTCAAIARHGIHRLLQKQVREKSESLNGSSYRVDIDPPRNW
jgi:hypothetical protein